MKKKSYSTLISRSLVQFESLYHKYSGLVTTPQFENHYAAIKYLFTIPKNCAQLKERCN